MAGDGLSSVRKDIRAHCVRNKTAFAKLGKRRKALKGMLLGLFHMSALAEPADSVLVDAHVYILAAVRFEFAAVGRKTE